jgi:hypothetical protein
MAASPSLSRALAIASSVAPTHPLESSYCEPEQLARKFGCGAMSAGGFCDETVPLAAVGRDGVRGGATGRGTVVLTDPGAGVEGLPCAPGGTVVLGDPASDAEEDQSSIDDRSSP